ncbi:MAG: preprotein translocase subunit TatB [Legionella sp. 40-6]|nr:twin-arginine translocase TatA/TatE family subunit [Legionella sp.]OJY45709.1 MAG: preprotein translocase subunit TatB [Legionella sp. 40-6]
MSLEILVILVVAILVFPPQKLPLLAKHMGYLLRQANRFKAHLHYWWEQQMHAAELEENQRKAEAADKHYPSKK